MEKSHKTCMEQAEIIDTFGTYQQYVLQMNDHADRDKDGNVVLAFVHSKFHVDDAAKQFKLFVRDDENLVDCKLVSSQICWFSLLYLFFLPFPVILFQSSNSKHF